MNELSINFINGIDYIVKEKYNTVSIIKKPIIGTSPIEIPGKKYKSAPNMSVVWYKPSSGVNKSEILKIGIYDSINKEMVKANLTLTYVENW